MARLFGFIAECVGISGRSDLPGHIYFGSEPNVKLPATVLSLRNGFEMASETIRQMYQRDKPEEFQRFFTELLAAAQLMSGDVPQIADADHALATIKETIVLREGPKMKKKYLNNLLLWVFGTLVLLVAFAAALIFLRENFTLQSQALRELLNIGLGNHLLMVAGAVMAMWVSFYSRKQEFTFEDLLHPERDMVSPPHRIIYVAVMTIFVAVLCHKHVVGVTIGGFSTTDIGHSGGAAMIFGLACGFSERWLAGTVAPKMESLIKAMSTHKTV